VQQIDRRALGRLKLSRWRSIAAVGASER